MWNSLRLLRVFTSLYLNPFRENPSSATEFSGEFIYSALLSAALFALLF